MSTDSHLPIDRSVRVPTAVAAAAAAADALLAQGAGPPPPPNGGPPPALGTEFVQIPTGGPPPPAGFTQPGFTQQGNSPAPPPQQVVIPPNHGGDQLPPPAQPGTVDAQWERRARSWRGQLDADRAQHQREMAGLRGQVDDLMNQLNARGAPPAAPGAASSTAHAAIALSPEKRAEYVAAWGEEMTDTMIGIATAIAGTAAGQVAQRAQADVAATREAMWARDNAAMQAALDQMLPGGNGQPDWRVVNDDEDYNMWLQQPDGFSNLTKSQVLKAAWQRNDTQSVYRIFAAYMGQSPLQDGGAGPGTVPPAYPPQGGAPQPSNRLPLHNLAAPGPARATPTGQQGAAEPNMYTTGHVAKFFQDKGRGVYNDTPQRQQWAAGIEADIFAAQKEGRVIPGPA